MITFILAVCGNVDYIYTFPASPPSRAAWIEITHTDGACCLMQSPPSRAAWIEIELVAEGKIAIASPPSRAAWIEISTITQAFYNGIVAAFTGGVD